MKNYIGTKIVKAEPRAGSAISGPSVDGYKVVYPDGYESWSPADVFEAAYREVGTMHFGDALHALKQGLKVAREGWNGAGQFAYLVPAAAYPVQTGAAKSHFGEGSLVPYRAYLALKTVQDDVATWAPSVSDVLADDWLVVD
jgi:hypothetical protein